MTVGGHPGGPPDPFGHPHPFGPGGPGAGASGAQGWAPGFGVPPPAPAPKINTLATLSLVFAVVFAPVGAVLGHLALSEIRRYGQAGRGRALTGLALSYLVIVVTAVALIAWPQTSPTTSARTAPSAAAPTSTTTTPPPPAPLVPASALPSFALTLEQVKGMVNAPNLNSSTDEDKVHVYDGTVYSPPECSTVFGAWDLVPTDPASQAAGPVTVFARGLQGPMATTGLSLLQQTVARMDSPGAAATFVLRVLQRWRGCAGKPATSTDAQGIPLTFTADPPTTAGAITTMRIPLGGDLVSQRVIAVKNNVVVELSAAITHPTDEAHRLAQAILDRIPG